MKNLALARLPLQPNQFFTELVDSCVSYGIDTQDVYNDYDKTVETSNLLKFEQQVAEHFSKEAGLFIPSGVMAQDIILAATASERSCKNFLCHWSSHLLIHEFDAYKHLLNLTAIIIPPNTDAVIQEPFTYASMINAIEHSGQDVNRPELAVVFVELPHREIGGKITPWEDLVKISQYCKKHNIHLHMDGARLWEATAAYSDHSVKEITELFDTIYVSFYKGIGAVTGAMLLGQRNYLTNLRPWLRRFGGNLYCHLPYFVSCLHSFHQNKDAFHHRKERFVEIVQFLTTNLLSQPSNFITVDGKQEPIIFFDPPLPLVSLVHLYVRGKAADVDTASKQSANDSGISCFSRIRPGRFAGEHYSYTEINLGPHNIEYTNEDWFQGYQALLNEIRKYI